MLDSGSRLFFFFFFFVVHQFYDDFCASGLPNFAV